MAKWRMKEMTLEEWAALQEQFGELQMAQAGNPDLAMFIRNTDPDRLSEIYLTGPGIDVLERLYPGGWQDSPAPSGKGVALLVGADDPWERFGIVYER